MLMGILHCTTRVATLDFLAPQILMLQDLLVNNYKFKNRMQVRDNKYQQME